MYYAVLVSCDNRIEGVVLSYHIKLCTETQCDVRAINQKFGESWWSKNTVHEETCTKYVAMNEWVVKSTHITIK